MGALVTVLRRSSHRNAVRAVALLGCFVLLAVLERRHLPALGGVLAVRPRLWIVLAAAVVVGTGFLGSATALWSAAGRRPSWTCTLLGQFVGAAANRVVPGGLAGIAINVRLLSRAGATSEVIAVSLAVVGAAHAVVMAGLLGAAGATTGSTGAIEPSTTSVRVVLLGMAVLLPVCLLVIAHPSARALAPRFRCRLAGLRAALGELRKRPADLAAIAIGVAAVRATHLFAMFLTFQACGADLSATDVLAAYAVGTAASAALPTPGGAGSGDLGAVAALGVLGAAAAPAIAGLLTYRAVLFVVPVLPSLAALWIPGFRDGIGIRRRSTATV
jgi:uncharacterized membrane protein YbhN (UPF0104 family)